MAITRKPKSNTNAKEVETEQAAEAFISSASAGQPVAPPDKHKTPIMIRFDPALLQKVDAAAKRRGISRSAWIQYVTSRALDSGEG